MKDEFKSLINRDELRRLEKAAKDKNKIKLADWATQFEESIRKEYDAEVKKELDNMVDIFILTIVYTLRYNESTSFGNRRIKGFMDDLLATIDNFNDGSYSPEEYREQLLKDGIQIISRKGDE